MKILTRIYIIISVLIIALAIYQAACSITTSMNLGARLYSVDEVVDLQETNKEYETKIREVLNQNIQYSCIYGGYAILSVVFGCIVFSKLRKPE